MEAHDIVIICEVPYLYYVIFLFIAHLAMSGEDWLSRSCSQRTLMKVLRYALRHTLDGKDLTTQYAETIVGCLGSKELKDETCQLLTEAVARELSVSGKQPALLLCGLVVLRGTS